MSLALDRLCTSTTPYGVSYFSGTHHRSVVGDLDRYLSECVPSDASLAGFMDLEGGMDAFHGELLKLNHAITLPPPARG